MEHRALGRTLLAPGCAARRRARRGRGSAAPCRCAWPGRCASGTTSSCAAAPSGPGAEVVEPGLADHPDPRVGGERARSRRSAASSSPRSASRGASLGCRRRRRPAGPGARRRLGRSSARSAGRSRSGRRAVDARPPSAARESPAAEVRRRAARRGAMSRWVWLSTTGSGSGAGAGGRPLTAPPRGRAPVPGARSAGRLGLDSLASRASSSSTTDGSSLVKIGDGLADRRPGHDRHATPRTG